MDTPMDVCLERNEAREDRKIHPGAVRRQYGTFRQGLSRTRKEGFHKIHRITPGDMEEGLRFAREKMRSDLREDEGPFDIIGDVHGCHEELMELLGKLGYTGEIPAHPEGRRAVFLGDLVDRGPASGEVMDTVMDMTGAGSALCVMGNHENRLMRSLRGNAVTSSHGLSQTLEQMERRDEKFREKVKTFLGRMDTHYVMDGGKLAVAHAGVIQAYQMRASGRARNFCLYGQTTGESDEWGLPVRQDWAQDYRGARARWSTATPRWPEPRLGQQHHQHRHRMRLRGTPSPPSGTPSGRPGTGGGARAVHYEPARAAPGPEARPQRREYQERGRNQGGLDEGPPHRGRGRQPGHRHPHPGGNHSQKEPGRKPRSRP